MNRVNSIRTERRNVNCSDHRERANQTCGENREHGRAEASASKDRRPIPPSCCGATGAKPALCPNIVPTNHHSWKTELIVRWLQRPREEKGKYRDDPKKYVVLYSPITICLEIENVLNGWELGVNVNAWFCLVGFSSCMSFVIHTQCDYCDIMPMA